MHMSGSAADMPSTFSASFCCQSVTSYHHNTHTHPFNGPFSGTTRVSRYQKGKTNLDFTEARYSEWQWHQLGNMQVCTSLHRDNPDSTPPLINHNKWSKILKNALIAHALVTPGVGKSITKPHFRRNELSPAYKSAALWHFAAYTA